jgi:hypothetical protein
MIEQPRPDRVSEVVLLRKINDIIDEVNRLSLIVSQLEHKIDKTIRTE